MNHIVRGILIGGSLGVFGWLILDTDPGRSIALGMIGGFLAGLTMARRAEKKDGDSK